MIRLPKLRARYDAVKRKLRGRILGGGAARHSLVGRPELWEMKRRFQLQFLQSRGLRPEHRLVDIGCGTLRGGIPIIAYLEAGHYYGVEARSNAIREAHKELDEAGLTGKRPTLIESADFAAVDLDPPVDFAWAFSVLIHLEDRILGDCLSAVGRWLNPDGVFYANVNIGDDDSRGWDKFPVVSRPIEFYRQQARNAGLAVADLGELGQLGHASGIARQDRQRMLMFNRQ